MQRRYIPAVVLFIALLVFLAHLGGHMEAAPAISLAIEKKEIYLTFDDGPSTRVTGRILDVCKEEGVKATFFIVGERVAGREEVLKRIADEGHAVGVHSYTHRYREIYASDDALLADVRRCKKLIEERAGVTPAVYRFPGGGTKENERRKALLEKEGLTAIAWNAVCGDEEIPHASAEVLVETAMKTAKGKRRVVLLLHDSAPHRATAEALPAIIAHFRDMGYVFKRF